MIVAPAQTYSLPKPPVGDSAAARLMARALRECADEIMAAQQLAHRVLEDCFCSWTGSSATAMRHPLRELDVRTHRVAVSLRDAADGLDHYAAVLDKAHHQHHWSWGKIAKIAAVVVVTTTVVVVTVGAATPAAAAVDGAIIGAEVAATGAAVTAASGAALEAAAAVSMAVRALQTLRAVATFMRPQIAVTAGLTDYEAFRQVRATGDLDMAGLVRHAGVDVAFGATGARLAGALGSLGAEAGNPVVQWMLPKLAASAGWGTTTATQDLLVEGEVDPWRVAQATGVAFGGAVVADLLPRTSWFSPAARSRAPIDTRTWLPFLASSLPSHVRGKGPHGRLINMRPRVPDPVWGLSRHHINKHLFGIGPLSLRTLDPGGGPAIWMDHVRSLASRGATRTRNDGVQEIIGEFPRTDGTGTFQFGIRLQPLRDGRFNLITLLTQQ